MNPPKPSSWEMLDAGLAGIALFLIGGCAAIAVLFVVILGSILSIVGAASGAGRR